jgi:LmeA-like phospholipid-binding
MELLTIILSGLLASVSPLGIILDQVVASNLRSRLHKVEELEVRIDNAPSYQIVQGKIERVRIATRGVQPILGLRIDTLELETDPIDVDLKLIQSGKLNTWNQFLQEPIQSGVRLELTEEDINLALQSPEILSRLQQGIDRSISGRLPGGGNYKLLQSSLDILGNNRLRVQAQLLNTEAKEEDAQPVEIMLELGVKVVGGRNLQLIEPTGEINGRRLSSRLLSGFAESLSETLDLNSLKNSGITARLLKLELENDRLNLAGFVRLEPSDGNS